MTIMKITLLFWLIMNLNPIPFTHLQNQRKPSMISQISKQSDISALICSIFNIFLPRKWVSKSFLDHVNKTTNFLYQRNGLTNLPMKYQSWLPKESLRNP